MSDIQFRGATISDLIGLPVVAIVNANDMMARQQVTLLMQNCFSVTGNVYSPIMITMLIHRGVIEPSNSNDSMSIRQATTSFQIPLITLLPINSLAIENVDIKFDMDVHSHHEVGEEDEEDEEDEDGIFGAGSSPSRSYELAGSIKYEPRDKPKGAEAVGGGAASISVSISAGKLPLPLGVSTIIQAYSHAIHPSDASPESNNDEK